LLRRRLPYLALLIALLALEVLGLKGMPYSTGWLLRTSLARALQPTMPLALGSLNWDAAPYQGAPALEPFRRVVEEHCAGQSPLETTICLSDLLAERFPHGEPEVELFDAHFDPVATMNHHLAGRPGHCVSRSGILATALLSVGIPARLVQMAPSFKVRNDPRGGHNAIEVWDHRTGWIFFDPTSGGSIKTPAGEQSAAALLAAGGGVIWLQLGKVPASPRQPLDGRITYAGNPTPRFSGNLVYPEPWLYTRTGVRLAPGPFRATFMVVGPPSLQLALGHWLIHGAIVATALSALGVFVQVVLSLLPRTRLGLRENQGRALDQVRRDHHDAAE
jgi:hypothetical protein